MVSRADIERLLALPPTPDSPVLTVYLAVDQSAAANLNREFETALRSRLRDLEQTLAPADRPAFTADAARVAALVAAYRPHARTLVVMADDSAGLVWSGELQLRIPTAVHREPAPFLRPLLEALDEHERYGVILADKERARVFTVFLGEIEEEREAFATAEVRHKNASGTDHWRSQMHFQREDDAHVRAHLRHVVRLADELGRTRAFDRLILAGPHTAATLLHHLLPKRLRGRVVATLRLPVDAPAEQVLRETLAVEARVERGEEAQRVEQLLTAAGKENGGVLGLDATLGAVQEARVWRLVYAAGYACRGAECPRCGALLATAASCPYCGAAAIALDDVLARAATRVADAGGAVEQVSGDAAVRLRDAGGVGALLRF